MGRSLVEFLATADVGEKNKNELAKWAAASAEDEGTFSDQFPIFRVETTANKDIAKIQIGVRHAEGRLSTIAAMLQLSARHLKGAAPPGHLEDEISDWIAYLEKVK